ncbi:MAG: aldehyde ferredoxin oxidoreductase family protein [Actinobacteria bacterium]|nr:aldehyde ferredoxin oxidoreductase family protein [Actinomycetota bacterium]
METISYGYTGRILRVDLNTGKTSVDQHDEVWYRTYMGGGCLAAWYMLKEMKPGVDPLGPDNILIFSLSPIVGAPVPTLSRTCIAAKSPLTNAFGETQMGGFFGPELKLAGWDAVIITGRAPNPVYLWINGEKVEMRDASQIWGKTTGESQEIIQSELGDSLIRVANIGPAGEKLVRFAAVLNNTKHACGRTGMGAVMGSKNLKALAVRGQGKFKSKNPDLLREKARWFAQNFMDNVANRELNVLGTAGIVNGMNQRGMLPTRNFRKGSFEPAEKLSGEAMAETILVKGEGCYACPVKCKRVVATQDQWKVDPAYGGPEYETIGALGTDCEVSDLAAVSKANEICNKYGLDTISTGATIAFAMECFEKGLISKEKADGLDLTWGNAEAMVKLTERIALRDGIGHLLAEGVRRAAEKIGDGAEQYAIHVKGQEIPMHEPRVKGMLGVTYAVSELGAEHTRVEHDTDFDFYAPQVFLDQAKVLGLLERLPNETTDEDKMRMYYYLQHHFSMLDTLGCCLFGFAPVRAFTMTDLIEITNATTGWETSLWELMKLGERRWNMTRAFNLREGFTAADDWLPERFFTGLENGPMANRPVDKDQFREALRLYYEMSNWDPNTAVPRRAKLIELDLKWIADAIPEWLREGRALREAGNLSR